MDRFFFLKAYFATFNSWESRDNELVTSAITCNRPSCGGYNDHASELTSLWHVCMKSAFPAGSKNRNCMFRYHLFSIMTFPSSVNILLRWVLIIIKPYSIWQHFSYSQNIPETVSPLHLFQSSLCITALIVDFPGKDSNELPPFLTANVNTVMCQNSIWEHSSDQ